MFVIQRFSLLEWVGAEEGKQVTFLMIIRDWLSRVGLIVKAPIRSRKIAASAAQPQGPLQLLILWSTLL